MLINAILQTASSDRHKEIVCEGLKRRDATNLKNVRLQALLPAPWLRQRVGTPWDSSGRFANLDTKTARLSGDGIGG